MWKFCLISIQMCNKFVRSNFKVTLSFSSRFRNILQIFIARVISFQLRKYSLFSHITIVLKFHYHYIMYYIKYLQLHIALIHLYINESPSKSVLKEYLYWVGIWWIQRRNWKIWISDSHSKFTPQPKILLFLDAR